MSKNKLSIYLIKEEISDVMSIFEEEAEVQELLRYSDKKCAYFVPSNVHAPKWLTNFFNNIHTSDLKQANSKVVLLVTIPFNNIERTFAITFGYAKHLFKEDVLEEQFGLKVVLNSVNSDGLRKISKINVGGNQKQSQEQIPKTGSVVDFGFDIGRDLVRMVTAKTDTEDFGSGLITGGDIFSVAIECDVNNVEEFLTKCYERFEMKQYTSNFDWVDRIKEVRSVNERQRLDVELLHLINNRDFTNIWMAVPEIISWELVKHFKYDGCSAEFGDIFIEKVVDTLRNPIIDVEVLKKKYIRAVSAEDENRDEHKWSAYRCLIAEIDIDGQSYCLNNNKWYKIENNFATSINAEYEAMVLSKIPFIDYDSKGNEYYSEDNYNEELTESLGNSRLLHKRVEIPYGGGQGNKIEVCDVMTLDKTIIHIKKNGGSALLSHLFSQAAVSAEALLDRDFRQKFNRKLIDYNFADLIDNDFTPAQYTVVIGIINKFSNEHPKIPFFSRVAMRYAVRAISNMGYMVKLKNINMVGR